MKILLFGSTGMLGTYVLKVLSKKYQIVIITRSDFNIELDTWDKLDKLLEKEKDEINIIVNCAGIIPQTNLQIDYRKYIQINSLFPHKLQDISNKYNYKFIHITTDCVFDGSKGNYDENDLHSEKKLYGVSKSIGEPETACIIRTSIIGEELLNKKSLLEWIISNKNKSIYGYSNHYWNGVTCLTLAKIINEIIEKNLYWKGVKHIYSPTIVSKYELCLYINEIYNLNINIDKFETPQISNKSLTSIYQKCFNIDDIKSQILELSNFKLN